MKNKIKSFFYFCVVFCVLGFLTTNMALAVTASKGIGATCNAGECYSGNCELGKCVRGAVAIGSACTYADECADSGATCTGLVCTAGAAGPGPTGSIVPASMSGLPENPDKIKGILTNVAKWLLNIIGIIAIIAFVISGMQYLFVASDEKMAEKAKKTMTYAVIGIVVALFGLIAIITVDTILRVQL